MIRESRSPTLTTSTGTICTLRRKTIKRYYFIASFLLLLSGVSFGQSSPAANRGFVSSPSDTISNIPIEREAYDDSRKQIRKLSKPRKVKRKKARKARRGLSIGEIFGWIFFWLGIAVMIFGAISVAWYGTLGAMIFLIALGIQVAGIGLITLGMYLAAGSDWIAGITALVALIGAGLAWLAWGGIGLFVWLIP